MRIGRKLAAAGKPGVIVTLFPDCADRYFEAPVRKQRPPAIGAAATGSAAEPGDDHRRP